MHYELRQIFDPWRQRRKFTIFLGAGFSADCLNFSEHEVGTASPLHELLNQSVGHDYSDMQLAADEYLEKNGESGLLKLLTEKYAITKRTGSVDEILKYPWARIYTTNYDNVISQSLTTLGVPHYAANNTEKPHEISKHSNDKKWIVHLHGSLRKWDIQNFATSCVLGRESYLRASSNSNWAEILREDYARANAVFFIGFSNSDFYLAEHLFSATASRDKVFFINSERSTDDRELQAKQKNFGESLAIGKENFATKIREALSVGGEPSLELHSFVRRELPEASRERASVKQQEDLLISGKTSPELQFRDILDRSHSYRAERTGANEIVDFLKKNSSVAIILGGICSGKSLLLDECILLLQTEGETIFSLQSKYYDLLTEAKRVIDTHPTAIIAIDNCYSLRSDLRDILKAADAAGTRVLLSARTLAHDSEEDLRTVLSADTRFRAFDTEILDEDEGLAVISCADRISGWGAHVSGITQKRRVLERDHSSRLSGFLLGIFKSSHIKNRFVSELDLLRASGKSVEKALILALYLKNIGETAQENVLSELLGQDAVQLFSNATGALAFVNYKPELKNFEVLPSVNAREALKQFFDPQVVTNTIVEAVRNVEHVRFQPAFNRVFTEFMRYTQLKQVVPDFEQQDRFFDRLSEVWFCNNHVLFKLQWSMAMRDHGEWPRAWQYLEEAYGQARAMDNFDTAHLDDQKAGLLLDSVSINATSADYFRITKEVCELLGRSMKQDPVTSHNYKTVASFDRFFEKSANKLVPQHKVIIAQSISNLRATVEKRYGVQPAGYIRDTMGKAIETLDRHLKFVHEA